MIPYGHQWVDEADIDAVIQVLRSDWLTCGPAVEEFEGDVAQFVGAKYAVAVTNGTAALHASAFAAGIGSGDEVIIPAITFVATANAIVFLGGTPIFVDVQPDTLLIDPIEVEKKITSRTKAIVNVDYAGHPADYDTLRSIAQQHDLLLIADACHSLGAEYKGKGIGTLADLSAFSFHPVKAITTGEGGMIVTDNLDFADRMRRFRNHGITTVPAQRDKKNTWEYQMVDLGYNYRITDLQCVLGRSQLKKLPRWLIRRQEIAREYQRSFSNLESIRILRTNPEVSHAYHLFVIRLLLNHLKADRGEIFRALRKEGIGVNVHYIPVFKHPYYQKHFPQIDSFPQAEAAYREILSLPIFPAMTDEEIRKVVSVVENVIRKFER